MLALMLVRGVLAVAIGAAVVAGHQGAAGRPPRTCEPGSPVAGLPYCDETRSFAERARLLTTALQPEEKLLLWHGHGVQGGVPRLNIAAYHRDTLCWQGPAFNVEGSYAPLAAPPFVTVFPNAINAGASFDDALVKAAANATASELRGVNELVYNLTGANAGPYCDVGPMANTGHELRWGRLAQIYSEDPHHAGLMTRNVVRGLQQQREGRTASGFLAGDFRYKVAVTVGLYIGAHGSNLVSKAQDAFELTPRDLQDQYLRPYGMSLRGDLQAEGVMCAHASFNGTPACANPLLLQTVLREQWNSSALVRTDCCDDIEVMVEDHRFKPTLEDAVTAAVEAGLEYCFGCNMRDNTTTTALAAALASGRVAAAKLDDAVARGLLTRFRLGEFDRSTATDPFGSGFAATVNSKAHRTLARQLAAASAVLIKNRNGRLPLAQGSTGPVAVIGPFGNCETNDTRTHGWVSTVCYNHEYVGINDQVSTLFSGLQGAVGNGTQVAFEQGTPASEVHRAVALAKASDVVILALGLGTGVESESVDRTNLTLPADQLELYNSVTDVAPHCIVVLYCAGPVDLDFSRAAAVVWAGYPGEEAGTSMADVLFGVVSPSGRLPLTWVKQEYLSMVGNMTDYSTTSGVGRTYRYIEPAKRSQLTNYWFGHGLSYSHFTYGSVAVMKSMAVAGRLRVSVSLINDGTRDAHEVVQVYASHPGPESGGAFPRPTLSLVGYAKTLVPKGYAQSVFLDVECESLALVWPNGTAIVPRTGNFTFTAGGSQPDDPNAASPALQAQVPADLCH